MNRLLLVFLVGVTVGCGPSAKQRTISTTMQVVNTARVAYNVYDADMERSIIAGAETLEAGRTVLSAWRAKSDTVLSAFVTVYLAIALAATDLSDQHLSELVTALAAFQQTYYDVIGKDPP